MFSGLAELQSAASAHMYPGNLAFAAPGHGAPTFAYTTDPTTGLTRLSVAPMAGTVAVAAQPHQQAARMETLASSLASSAQAMHQIPHPSAEMKRDFGMSGFYFLHILCFKILHSFIICVNETLYEH